MTGTAEQTLSPPQIMLIRTMTVQSARASRPVFSSPMFQRLVATNILGEDYTIGSKLTDMPLVKSSATKDEETEDHVFFLQYAVAMAEVARLKHDTATSVGAILHNVVTKRGVGALVPPIDSTPFPARSTAEAGLTDAHEDEQVSFDIEDNILSHADGIDSKCDKSKSNCEL